VSWSSGRFEVVWDASTLPDGTHQVVARAVDGAGNSQDSAAVGFQIGDVVAPTVTVESPERDASVNGIVTIVADARDDRAVTQVAFLVDGQGIGTVTTPPWQIAWDATGFGGYVVLTAKAKDAAGHETTSAAVPVFVDVTPPTVEIVSPVDGATVFGLVPLVAAAKPVPGDGFWPSIMRWERAGDSPLTAFPAFHIVWTCIAVRMYVARWRRPRSAWYVVVAAVAASCVTTGMHWPSWATFPGGQLTGFGGSTVFTAEPEPLPPSLAFFFPPQPAIASTASTTRILRMGRT